MPYFHMSEAKQSSFCSTVFDLSELPLFAKTSILALRRWRKQLLDYMTTLVIWTLELLTVNTCITTKTGPFTL